MKMIACSIFRSALSWLAANRGISLPTVHYLPAYLHLKPMELKKCLVEEIGRLRERTCRICCLYGRCFPDIDQVLQDFNVPRMPGDHCFEILLGADRFKALIQKQPGTFFIEREVLVNFDTYCWDPLELGDAQLRKWYFKYYRHMLYIRQPLDPDLAETAGRIAERLNLSLRVEDADYRELNRKLTRLLYRIAPR